MTYEGYRQNQPGGYGQQGGYGQYNPYEEESNQYQQQPAGYGDNQPYSTRPEPHPQASSRYDDAEQGNGRYEMSNVSDANSRDQNYVLNVCRSVDDAVNDVEKQLERLQRLHQRSLDSPDISYHDQMAREVRALNEEIMRLYASLIARINGIKQNPDSRLPRNSAQVGKVERKLRTSKSQYQQIQSNHRKRLKEQNARQYRIVRPDASDMEVQEALENSTGNQQIFSDALINSDRRGQALAVQNRVTSRHAEIQEIEQQMLELAQLFQDLEALVVQQENQVTQIEDRGGEVTENVGKANVQIDTAIKSARAARRKKFWCLGIVILIIIIIVVVVVVAVELTRPKK